MKPTTLVTGGTGLIGGEVILALAREGYHVRALVRARTPALASARLFERLEKSEAFSERLRPLIEPVMGDTTTEMFGAAPASLADLGAIIHCAANTSFEERTSDNILSTNVGGAQHLVRLARAAAPRARVVFVSTASVVTAPEGRCLDETAPPAGYSNTYTRSKREAEQIVSASGLDTVIVRPSIVLSRGVRDRVMARSILWAVPIMGAVGALPIDPDAHVDFVPVDYVARAIIRLAVKPMLRHPLYHISAGIGAHTFGALLKKVVEQCPELECIQPLGRHAKISPRLRERLLRPLDAYLPFVNADVCYANERLVTEIGSDAHAPSALSYVPQLVAMITLREALDEMLRP
jgi:nucleoside-diphosphate-sugar epimerase